MRFAVPALLLLAPPLASRAATLTLTDPLVSAQECVDRASQEVEVTWSFSGSSGTEIQLVSSDVSGCPDASTNDGATTAVLVEGITASASGSYGSTSGSKLYLSDVMSGAGVESAACGATSDTSLYVCARLLDSSGSTTATASARLKLQVTAPPPPVDVAVTPGESALVVAWAAGTATDEAPAASKTYRAFATAGGVTSESSETSDTSVRMKGLEIGTTYDVRVVAYSEAGNPSAASELVAGTPVNVTDYWESYQQHGGAETGGCGHAAGLPALLGLAALALRRRGRGAAAALLLAAAPAAWADPGGAWGSFELRASSWRPDLDAEFRGSASPYADAFGKGRGLLGGAHLGYEVWRGFGAVELGFGASYGQRSGHGRLDDGSVSADTTRLRVLPLALTLTWRVEELYARLGVPLLPYLRLSLVRDLWWTQDGNGGTSSWVGRRGSGATDGWAATAGLALALDALDPTLSRDMRRDVGGRHTSLFVDVTHERIDDFGARSSWNLSDASLLRWSGGLLFSF